MAKAKFGLDFDGFLDYARKLDKLGDTYLKKATDNALNKSLSIFEAFSIFQTLLNFALCNICIIFYLLPFLIHQVNEISHIIPLLYLFFSL